MQVTTLGLCQSREVNFSRRCQHLIDVITFDPVLVFFVDAMTARPICCKFMNQNNFFDNQVLPLLGLQAAWNFEPAKNGSKSLKKKETFSQHLGLESRLQRSISQEYIPVHLSEPGSAKGDIMSLERPELSSWPLRRPPEPSWPSKGEAFTGDGWFTMPVLHLCLTYQAELPGTRHCRWRWTQDGRRRWRRTQDGRLTPTQDGALGERAGETNTHFSLL